MRSYRVIRLNPLFSIAILIHLLLDLMQTGNMPFWPLQFKAGLNMLPYDIPGRVATIPLSALIFLIDHPAQCIKHSAE
jgi:hypothetical protein